MKSTHLVVTPLAMLVMSLAACASPSPMDDVQPSDSLSWQDDGLTATALTRAEAQTVLKLIDDICGDTWCEGDYNFRFHCLVCSQASETCTLALQMLPHQEGPSPPNGSWHVCKTGGFSGFDSLVETSSTGHQALRTGYYEALSACISDLEEQRLALP